jgi:tetratricopeptide (TPR) repeat protein
MRQGLPPEHVNIAYALSGVIGTLNGADKAHALLVLFPTLAEAADLELVFREVALKTKASKLDSSDPARMAARGLTGFIQLYGHLADELASTGKTREAEEAREMASRVLDKIEAELAGNSELLPYVCSYGAAAFLKAGQPERANSFHRKLLGLVTPKTGQLQNEAAWLLVTTGNLAHRDAALAIELAKKAVESSPRTASYRNTLGVARYRAGDWKQAVSDLNESVSLSKDGDGFGWFFLAMAHWQLGNKDQADQSYNRAVTWMEKKLPNDEQLRQFRTEARDLIYAEPGRKSEDRGRN